MASFPYLSHAKFINSKALGDTSSMYYYSFEHHKTIEYRELLTNSDVSFIKTCVGREIVLTAPNYGENAKYVWEGPNGFTSESSELKFTSVALKDDGLYVVNVLKGEQIILGKIKLIVRPKPLASVNKDKFKEDEAIQLQADDNTLNAKYEWRDMDKKIISKSKDLWVSPKKKGNYNYFLTVNKDGCETSKNIEISVGSEDINPVYNNVVDVLRHSKN